MSFHEVRFPTDLSFGSTGGPERRVEIVALSNGFEERNAPWAHSRRRYDAGLGLRSADDLADVIAFFEARGGQLYGFRWKDWADAKSCKPLATPAPGDQLIGVGDGSSTDFQLSKTYLSGPASYTRPIRKPVAGTVRVALDGVEASEGVDFTVDSTTGLVSFTVAPGNAVQITAGFEFDVPVRFDTDRIHTSLAAFDAGEVPSIPVVEVRV
ncbi:MAG: TIGR02217 family protein [Alphaproteobacteria bacterium]|nr:MAG: TIGR02217 family protein [Alphaproteobacteria bacterium]